VRANIFMENYNVYYGRSSAAVTQSVERLATGWTTEGSEFESLYSLELSRPLIVQVGSGSHLASFQMGTGGLFPGGKAAGAWS
jgi:hypothetical protein